MTKPRQRKPNEFKLKLIRKAIYDKETGCLNSLNSKDSHGYPRTSMYSQVKNVHRVLLELKLGQNLDREEYAIHKCNNRACISTAVGHVTKGDARENVSDQFRAKNRYHLGKLWKY